MKYDEWKLESPYRDEILVKDEEIHECAASDCRDYATVKVGEIWLCKYCYDSSSSQMKEIIIHMSECFKIGKIAEISEIHDIMLKQKNESDGTVRNIEKIAITPKKLIR